MASNAHVSAEAPQVLVAGGRRFLLINGRRRWIDLPPAETLPDLIDDQIAREWCKARGVE
jgi:hypothetical protein